VSNWAPKRFWSSVTVTETPDGFGISLDNKPVNTPSKTRLIVPTRGLAELIAAEWEAQQGKVDPRKMPATRAANSALDKVLPQKSDVADLIAAYGDSDYLCYRATNPAALIERQSRLLDPILDWAATALNARLVTGPGVVPIAQDPAAIRQLRERVHGLDHFQLTGFHDLVSLSGSLILGFAVTTDYCSPERAWGLSRIDEDWQAEHWGDDDDAMAHAALKRAAFLDAARFYRLSSQANAT
jgi:chaperone required for assembly of F1-ATPase